MPTYYINEAAFMLPDVGFADRTIHVLEARLPEGAPLGFLIARSRIEPGKSLQDLARDHVRQDQARLNGFTILDEAEATVAGAPAILLRSRWRHDGGVLYQRQVHIAAFDTWMLYAMTAPIAQRTACDEAFDQVLSTLRLRDTAT